MGQMLSLKALSLHSPVQYSHYPILQMRTPRLRSFKSSVLTSLSYRVSNLPILLLPLHHASFNIIDTWDLQNQTSLAFSNTQLLCFAGLFSTISEVLSRDAGLHAPWACWHQPPIYRHLPAVTHSFWGITRILYDSAPFVPQNLTSINMTTQAGQGTKSNLHLLNAGWCDKGRRGGHGWGPDVSHVPRINMCYTHAHTHYQHKLLSVKFRIKTN